MLKTSKKYNWKHAVLVSGVMFVYYCIVYLITTPMDFSKELLVIGTIFSCFVASAIVSAALYVIYRFVVSKRGENLGRLWATYIVGYLFFTLGNFTTWMESM